jgi:hypothetical protein
MSEQQAKRQRLHELETRGSSSPALLRLRAAVAARDRAAVTELLQIDRVLYADNSRHVPSLMQQDGEGRTPLHVCAALPVEARRDVYAMLEQLLEECHTPACEGALLKQDAGGNTVLHVLVEHQQLSLLRKLLYACTTLQCLTGLISAENSQGVSAGLLAQQFGCDAVLNMLKEFSAEVSRIFLNMHIKAHNQRCIVHL